MRTEHLLIIRFSTIDDVALLVPVVEALSCQHPGLRITVLSTPQAQPLFDGLAQNVGFMAADLKGEYRKWKSLNALYRRLTAKNFTAVADMQSVLRSGYLRMRFNLGLYRVEHLDLHRKLRRKLAKSESSAALPSLTDDYLDVLHRLGYLVEMTKTA